MRSVSAPRYSQTLQTDPISAKMDSHEIHPPPAVQIHPHFPTREAISTTESSILDIPHHDAEWTTFLTMPTQNRIVDASPGSALAETDCLGFSGDKFCATAIPLTSWGSVHRVLSVPAESPFQSIRGGTEQVKTSSSTFSLPDYPRVTPSSLNIQPSSQLVPSTSATTLQTQTVSSLSLLPSRTSAADLNPSTTQFSTDQLHNTPVPPKPTSNDMNQSAAHQSGPIVAYIILGVFFGFGIICALVTNRKIINWVQESVRKRREMEEARRKVEGH